MSYRETLIHILIPIVEDLQREANAASNRDLVQKFGEGLNALYAHSAMASPRETPVPAGTPISDNWLSFVRNEIAILNRHGCEVVSTTAEAYLKASSLMNAWHAVPSQRGRFFFRGEVDFGWTLLAPCARPSVGFTSDGSQINEVTPAEIDLLRDFQDGVLSDPARLSEIFPSGSPPDREDPQWWGYMQHYASQTRLLDITSSVFSGLFFACTDFDGQIDTDIDGKLYLFPRLSGWRSGEDDRLMNHSGQSLTVANYFSVPGSPDTPRFVEMASRNDRLIAQDGYFLWQPRFDDAVNVGQHFPFRVSRNSKESILRELYSLGYTARRMIRGAHGDQVHERLCEALDLQPS